MVEEADRQGGFLDSRDSLQEGNGLGVWSKLQVMQNGYLCGVPETEMEKGIRMEMMMEHN